MTPVERLPEGVEDETALDIDSDESESENRGSISSKSMATIEELYQMDFIGLTYQAALEKLATLPLEGIERIDSVDDLGFTVTNEYNPRQINFALRSSGAVRWADERHAHSYARSHPDQMVVESFYWG